MRRSASLALLALQGCAAITGSKPVIENRFRTYTNSATPPATVRIRVSTGELAGPDRGIALTSLSDAAQAAMVVATAGKPPIVVRGAGAPTPVVTLRDAVQRHVVIAIQPEGFLPPGDRVDAIRVSLRVRPATPERWRVSNWSQISNGEEVIQLGKLTDTTSSKVSLSTGLKIAPFLPDAKVEGENGRISAREVGITDSTEFDAGIDGDGVAWLHETAAWRSNLAHNLAMDVLLTTSRLGLDPRGTVLFSPLEATGADGRQVATDPSQVSLRAGTVYAPLDFEREPICGVATLTYRVRHITNAGASTFSESDDTVEFQTGTDTSTFLFAPSPFVPAHVLRSGGRPVSYRIGDGPTLALVFSELEDATAFRDWLQLKTPLGGRLANATLGFSIEGKIRPLTGSDYRDLNPGPQNLGREADDPVTACGPPAR